MKEALLQYLVITSLPTYPPSRYTCTLPWSSMRTGSMLLEQQLSTYRYTCPRRESIAIRYTCRPRVHGCINSMLLYMYCGGYYIAIHWYTGTGMPQLFQYFNFALVYCDTIPWYGIAMPVELHTPWHIHHTATRTCREDTCTGTYKCVLIKKQ